MDSRLQELIDARAIEGLMVEYFDGIDALDPYRAVEIFTDDAEGDFMTGRPVVGKPAMAKLLGRILLQYEHTSHDISNHRAVIRGDEASAVTYIHAFHRIRDSEDTWQLWARHVDELVRVDDGWRVKRRILHGVDSIPHWEKVDRAWYYGHPGRRTHDEMERQLDALRTTTPTTNRTTTRADGAPRP